LQQQIEMQLCSYAFSFCGPFSPTLHTQENSGQRDKQSSGEEAGSKLEKAQKLGVEIIDEAQFQRLCGGTQR